MSDQGSRAMPRDDDYPRSLRDESVRMRRKAMLAEPHVAPLTAYAARLRSRGMGEVPEFDPLDGGINARALFLFEKPGPKTSEARGGSGFVSRNNDDRTAEATFRFMQQAGIPRELTVIWNVVPWWNSTASLCEDELTSGGACVQELIALLPKLRVAVLVGKHAATRAQPYFENGHLPLLKSAAPSPRVRATRRDLWGTIPLKWAQARQFI